LARNCGAPAGGQCLVLLAGGTQSDGGNKVSDEIDEIGEGDKAALRHALVSRLGEWLADEDKQKLAAAFPGASATDLQKLFVWGAYTLVNYGILGSLLTGQAEVTDMVDDEPRVKLTASGLQEGRRIAKEIGLPKEFGG
jgi:hypothetical protein